MFACNEDMYTVSMCIHKDVFPVPIGSQIYVRNPNFCPVKAKISDRLKS